jgi:predicted ATPase
MRIDKVYIKRYKNLIDFTIDLNEDKMETVLLGKNATGKSNFIEALVLIFKNLDLNQDSPFEYEIWYQIKHEYLHIRFDNGKYEYFNILRNIKIDGQKGDLISVPGMSKVEFLKRKNDLLPKYVFTYYSGISNKLKDHFDDHQKKFYDKAKKEGVKKEDVNDLRRLFYAQLIHSYFVLLAYFSFKSDDEKGKKFLKDILSIEDLDSVLFVLHRPSWKGKGDKRFWGASGLVEEFLSTLWDNSLAPIYNEESVKIDFRRNTKKELLYLYVRNKEYLQKVASEYKTNTDFFKALESTYISDLMEEVRVRVKKTGVDSKIMFRDLSEGEQQLLTVLGLLKFTKDDESLILLDEPDTHLNPIWKWKYREFLNDVVDRPDSTQIIINTHDPLVIGSMTKEEVRVFTYDVEEKRTKAIQPDIDPRGLGVAGILTSELFGLSTTLDEQTQNDLQRKRELQLKLKEGKITKKEKVELDTLEEGLEKLGFSKYQRDPLYQKFIEATLKVPALQKPALTKEERQNQDEIMVNILDEILKTPDKP